MCSHYQRMLSASSSARHSAASLSGRLRVSARRRGDRGQTLIVVRRNSASRRSSVAASLLKRIAPSYFRD